MVSCEAEAVFEVLTAGCTFHYRDSEAQMVDQSFRCNLWVLVAANVAPEPPPGRIRVMGYSVTTPHHRSCVV